MKLWAGFSIWTTIAICICTGISIGVLVSGWKASAITMWTATASQIERNVKQTIEEHLSRVQFAANFVPISTASDLLDYYGSYDISSGYRFGSMGYLTRGNSSSNAKLSWQIAKYFVCPIYGYFYSNATINPNFYGYCANQTQIDYSIQSYSGFDWGLKPEEVSLIDGTLQSTFLPIFNLLGQFTLTYETRRISNGIPYASFAELDLGTFTSYVASNVSVFNGKGYAYVVETDNGQMIASTIPQTVTFNETRLTAPQSPSSIIRDTYKSSDDSTWLISTFDSSRTGFEWTTYVVIERSKVYGDLYYSVMIAAIICMCVALIVIGLTFLGVWLWITKPVRTIVKRLKGEHLDHAYTPISDFDEITKLSSNV